jgi:ceramide glucosyltransferase
MTQAAADLSFIVSLLGVCYLVYAGIVVRRFPRDGAPKAGNPLGITVLKPLKGGEPGLEENLRSFLETDYRPLQLIFGVRDPEDPARGAVESLPKGGPEVELVIDARVHGQNPKVSNLINMLGRAKHPYVVLADSDIRVGPDYYGAVTAPLAEKGVGAVTCLYVGRPGRGLWSRLGAFWVNYAFLPAALVEEALGLQSGCFGATVSLKRDTLDRIGGLEPLKDLLADDYALGAAVRGAGLRVVVSRYLVDMVVTEEAPGALLAHELRWLRTIRSINPLGFAGLVFTHPLPFALLGLALGGVSPLGVGVLGAYLLARFAMVLATDSRLGLKHSAPWLLLLRDLLSFGLFVSSYWGNRVGWRGSAFELRPDGSLLQDGRSRP